MRVEVALSFRRGSSLRDEAPTMPLWPRLFWSYPGDLLFKGRADETGLPNLFVIFSGFSDIRVFAGTSKVSSYLSAGSIFLDFSRFFSFPYFDVFS